MELNFSYENNRCYCRTNKAKKHDASSLNFSIPNKKIFLRHADCCIEFSARYIQMFFLEEARNDYKMSVTQPPCLLHEMKYLQVSIETKSI